MGRSPGEFLRAMPKSDQDTVRAVQRKLEESRAKHMKPVAETATPSFEQTPSAPAAGSAVESLPSLEPRALEQSAQSQPVKAAESGEIQQVVTHEIATPAGPVVDATSNCRLAVAPTTTKGRHRTNANPSPAAAPTPISGPDSVDTQLKEQRSLFTMPVHPVAAMVPRIEGESFEMFKRSIQDEGQRERIATWHGSVIDGRNRLAACLALGIMPQSNEMEFENEAECVEYIISRNIHRRHLTDDQRKMIMAELVTKKQGDPEILGVAIAAVARMGHVSEAGVEVARTVVKRSPTLAKQVKEGKLSLNKAMEQCRKPKAKQPTSVRSAAVEPGSSHAPAGAKSLPSRADEAEPTTPVAVEANGNPALGGAGPSASKSLADITAALACLREAWNLARKHRDTIGDAQLSEAIQGMLLDMVEHDTLDLQAIAARIKELAKQVK